MSATILFIILAVIFFAALLIPSYFTKNWAKNASDFTLAGREIGGLMGTSAVLAIVFAGTNLALVPSFAINFGFTGTLIWCLLFSVGYTLYALVPGRTFRRCGAQTLPEWLEMRYSKKVRFLVSITSIIGMCGIMANNVAAFSTLLATFTGIPGVVSIIICFVIMIAFAAMSGQWAVKITDFVQVIIGIIAIPLATILIVKMFGLNFLSLNWPAESSWLTHGFTGASLSTFSLKYPSLLTFVVLNTFFLVWGSNYFFLTAAVMRTEKVMKKAFIWSSCLQIFIVYLPLIIIGLYAATAHPTTFKPIGNLPSTAAYSLMLMSLASAVAAFALIGAMAASISTSSTALIASQATATRDIYMRKINPNATAKQSLMASRIILICIGILCLLLTFYPGGPTYLFAFANSWMGPPAILLVIGIFWRKVTAAGALFGVVIGMFVMAFFTVLDLSGIFNINTIMHVGVAGLITTFSLTIIISLFTKPPYYGKSLWKADPSQRVCEDITLQDLDLKVLELIRSGLDHMAEITDYIGLDSSQMSLSMERLDRGGYIKRQALYSVGFYTFTLTTKGKTVLPALSAEDKKLYDIYLTPVYMDLMRAINDNAALETFLTNHNLTSGALTSIVSSLTRRGYILQKGLVRRKLELTKAGFNIIEKLTT